MAKSVNSPTAPASNGAGPTARDLASEMLTNLATSRHGETLADSWGHLASFVTVGSGTYDCVFLPVPTEIDFEARARYAISEVEALPADKDHDDYVDALMHVAAGRGHDKLKNGLDVALRLTAEATLTEAGDPISAGNVNAMVAYFQECYADPGYRQDIDERISRAVTGAADQRRNRKTTATKTAVVTKAASLLVKRTPAAA